MNFTKRVADFFKQFVPPRPQTAPKVTRVVAPSSLNQRRRCRWARKNLRGAFGRRIFRIERKPAINAARGPRPNTWWKHRGEPFILRSLHPVYS